MLEFGILGPLEVRRDGTELALGGRNQRAVLALLLLNANRVVSIDRLADDLYHGATPVTAVTQVHRQVSELRRALDADGGGERIIETRPPGYVVRVARDALDAHRFEAELERAARAAGSGEFAAAADALALGLELWRGPALADLAGEPFAQGAIARLEELRLAAVEGHLEAELALGHHARVIADLQTLIADHPFRERLRELLMTALYRGGRQVEALAVFRDARRALVDAFGVEPGPALQALNAAVLQQDAALGAAPSPTAEQRGTVVLVARDPDRLEALAGLAAALARRPPRELVLALLAGDAEALGPANRRLADLAAGLDPRPRTAAFVARRASEDILHLARSNDAELVLVEGAPGLLEPDGPEADLVALLDGSSADVALTFAPPSPSAGAGILVPFGGGEHDWAAVELGAWLAAATGEPLRLAGVHAAERDASRLLADASLAVQRVVGVAAEPLLLEAGPDALAAAGREAAVVVVGLSPRWRTEGLGTARRALVEHRAAPVLVVHHGPRPSGIAPRESATRFTWTIAPAS